MRFTKPKMSVVRFAAADVIATSGEEQKKIFTATVPKHSYVGGGTTTHTCENYCTHYYTYYAGLPYTKQMAVYVDGTHSDAYTSPYGTPMYNAGYNQWFIATENGTYQRCTGSSQ